MRLRVVGRTYVHLLPFRLCDFTINTTFKPLIPKHDTKQEPVGLHFL